MTEIQWRLTFFLGTLLLMVLWEQGWPKRSLLLTRWRRWPNNLAVMALGAALIRLIFPAAAMGIALLVERNQWGLLHQLSLPRLPEILVTIVLLDFAIWAQHRLFHAVPWLWRLHRMHHADLDFDVTTGVRFHPLEIFLSILIKAGIILLLGAAPVAVIAFEILLSTTSLFNHGNVRLAPSIDRRLRWLVVTPDMHRVHHSWHRDETDSNFGFNLPWWDRLFGTYRAQPREGHAEMTIGLKQFREEQDSRLDRLLLQPLR